MQNTDTIAAIATPPGKGGIGVIRLSGPQALAIAEKICGRSLPERKVVFSHFKDGLAIYFAAPKSFTGEDVVELQGHGGPIIQDILLKQLIQLGARQARAGEFSERAFLNDKIDLTQAEAIADLIDSSTAQAAKGAMRSLQGEFSNKVANLLKELIYLRMYVEAAIDFPEEEIDFLADEKVQKSIGDLQQSLQQTIRQAGQGAILRNGLTVVLAGKPNAGKSSLINTLSDTDAAIVTDIPGTTRDTVTQSIDLDGLPVHIIDTAGLRESDDKVEQIGVARARQAMQNADHILYLVDAYDLHHQPDFKPGLELGETPKEKTTLVVNKIDLLGQEKLEEIQQEVNRDAINIAYLISATRGDGIGGLKEHIKLLAGFDNDGETLFTARRRHLSALDTAQQAVQRGLDQLQLNNAGELLADELLQAQNALNEITGEFSADDLLGEIFAGFCIGK